MLSFCPCALINCVQYGPVRTYTECLRKHCNYKKLSLLKIHIWILNLFYFFNCSSFTVHKSLVTPNGSSAGTACSHVRTCTHASVHPCLCFFARLRCQRAAFYDEHTNIFLCKSVCPQSVSWEAPWICRKGFWAAENWVQQHWYWPPRLKVKSSMGSGLIKVSLSVGFSILELPFSWPSRGEWGLLQNNQDSVWCIYNSCS